MNLTLTRNSCILWTFATTRIFSLYTAEKHYTFCWIMCRFRRTLKTEALLHHIWKEEGIDTAEIDPPRKYRKAGTLKKKDRRGRRYSRGGLSANASRCSSKDPGARRSTGAYYHPWLQKNTFSPTIFQQNFRKILTKSQHTYSASLEIWYSCHHSHRHIPEIRQIQEEPNIFKMFASSYKNWQTCATLAKKWYSCSEKRKTMKILKWCRGNIVVLGNADN